MPNINGRTLIFLMLIALLPSLSAHADVRTVNDRMVRARGLAAGGDVDGALGLYRSLYRENPGRIDILFALHALLCKAGRYDEALDLLEKRLQRAPGDIGTLLRLGDALYASGRQDDAFGRWDRILKGATSSGAYALVAQRYQKHNHIGRAEAIYREGRAALGNPRLFARELAELAERQARYPQAVSEYLLLLQEKPQYLSLTESRLREFAREGDRKQELFSMLAEEVRTHPDDGNRMQLLIAYALAAGQAGPVLRVLMGHAGAAADHRAFLRVASYALEAGEYTTAADAYRAAIERYASANLLPPALLGLARAREGEGRIGDARGLYRDIVARYPRRPEADEAGYRLGRLLRDTDGDAGAALRAFRALVGTGRRTPWRYRALFDIAEMQFQADRFDDAGAALERIIGERQGQDEADHARFRAAELRFFAADFEAADGLLGGLLAGSPARYALNDALALSILIREGLQEGADVLKAYAVAQKRRRQGKTGPALRAFGDFLAHHPESGLADRALVARFELLEALGRYPEAIQTCRQLIADIPWSPLCPRAQMALGRIYEVRLGQYGDARRAYETLLLNYARSLEADDARDRLRALREKTREPDAGGRESG